MAVKKGLTLSVFVLRTAKLEKKTAAITMPPKRKTGPGKVRACGHILLVCCDRRCLLMQTDFEMDIKEGNYDGVRVLGAFLRASLSHTGPSCEKLCSSSRSTIENETRDVLLPEFLLPRYLVWSGSSEHA